MKLFRLFTSAFLCILALFLASVLFGCKKDESVILRSNPVPPPKDTVVIVPVDTVPAPADTVVDSVETPVDTVPAVDTVAPVPPPKVEAKPISKKKITLITSQKKSNNSAGDSLALLPVPTEPDSAMVALCSDVGENEFCDLRDGKRYDIVVIGRQTWFRRNLAYETEGSWCPNDQEENCTLYGRLYQWSSANSCPEGWHLPTMRDFAILHDYVLKKNAGQEGVGTSLKTIVGWNDDDMGEVPVGTNRYGFGAKPAGYRDNRGLYVSVGDEANFWTSHEIIGENRASYWNLYYGNQDFIGSYVGLKTSAMSVRCIKD